MKKVLLTGIIAFASFVITFGQTTYPKYQNGKIWFKIKSTTRINASLKEDPLKLNINTLPFLSGINRQYHITGLSRPFYAAKDSRVLEETYLLKFSDYGDVEAIIGALKSTGKVDYAERVPYDHTTSAPNDPYYSSQWALQKINAAGAWNYFSTGSNIVVAVVDNAIQITHPDLQTNIWVNPGEIPNNGIDDDGNGYVDDVNGYDVADNDNNPNPPNTTFDHGTHVSGIAGAVTNNGTGIASIGYSIKIMAVKAEGDNSSPDAISNGYDGVTYAAVSGARVINMSWGSSSSSTTGQNVINYAYSKGCILVAAAGNSSTNTQFYPAAYTHVISVACTTSSDKLASYSNYGSWVTICAPGDNIYSTVPNNTYATMSGTSMASPCVAGLCGLMLSLNPGLTQNDVQNCLVNNADNIDSQNPSYVGQLGGGRINAQASMSCISSTLNWPPVAYFSASDTVVTAGGTVTYTDQSVYNPTSWQWTFSGGTPATYSGQTPPAITYNTAGTYNTQLIVSNAYGSDTLLKTNYITVTQAGSCDTINFQYVSGSSPTWTGANYYTGNSPGQAGWINGVDSIGDKQKAAYFDASATPYTYITGAFIGFGLAYSATPSKIVPVHVYDGTSGSPGALLATTNLTMQQIMSDVNNNYYTQIHFSSPVQLPTSKKFFISVDLTNLSWPASGSKDTLSIVSNSNGQTSPSAIWEQKSDGNWYQYGTSGSWNLNASLYVFPFATNEPTIATYTQSSDTICSGNTINFDATGSTHEDTLLWVFNGGSPSTSNSLTPTVSYNTAGTYPVKLYVIGGGCPGLDSMVTQVVIKASPTINISASGGTTICSSGTVSLTASGASSYTWSPSTGLNTTSGASVTAGPSNTTTYNVTGSNGTCSSTSSITVTVQQPPVASATASPTTICAGDTVLYDASLSSNVTNFSWQFPGGTPASANTPTINVVYGNAGTYTTTLHASNTCGTDSSYSQSILVNAGPSITASSALDTICSGSSTTFTASGANSYQWAPSTGLSSTTTATPTASPTSTTTYTVTGTGSNSCTSTATVQLIVHTCLGIQDMTSNNAISAFYNGEEQMLNVRLNNQSGLSKKVNLTLYNHLGQLILHKTQSIESGMNTIRINVSPYADGVYLLEINDDQGGSWNTKFFKN